MSGVVAKEYRELVAEAQRRGWVLTHGRGKHAKLTAPDGYACPVPGSSRAPKMYRGWRSRLLKHPTFEDYPR